MLHGTAVAVESHVKALSPAIEHAMGEFRVKNWREGVVPISGTIWPYDQSHVLRYMSPTARRIASQSDLLELYEEDERFWLVDDRWGIAEMNLLKGTWRSWILPNPQLDTVRCVQMSMLWPMAQLLRARSVQVLRTAWPIFELHPNRRHGQLPARLAQKVPTYQLHLSREPRDLLKMLAALPIPAASIPAQAQPERIAV
jgi:hypothetical protein